MKTYTLLLAIVGIAAFSATADAACSKQNLTRCLDSACAIAANGNPAARCQYCGTSGAGTPPTDGMRAVSVGTTKYNIPDKEVKRAPTDPGARYAWATARCITIVDGCTADDVSDTYDSLIEQSCRAAGISADMAKLQETVNKTKTSATCQSEVKNCIIGATKCGPDWSACRETAEFDRYLAECGVNATGCDEFMSSIRTELDDTRTQYINNANEVIDTLVASYAAARERRMASARATCTDNHGRDTCIEMVCERSMPNKCAPDFANERSMATQLCKFYDTACALLK